MRVAVLKAAFDEDARVWTDAAVEIIVRAGEPLVERDKLRVERAGEPKIARVVKTELRLPRRARRRP